MKRNVKKKSRLRHRQTQKMSRRQIVILTSSCIALMSIGLTIFMNLSNTDKSRAAGANGPVSVMNIVEPDYNDIKSLSVPVVRQMPATDEHTVFVRQAKKVRFTENNSTN